MKGLQRFVLTVFVFFAANVGAVHAAQQRLPQPDTLPLTLNDVLRMMLENNLSVSVERLPPNIAESLTGTYFQPFQPTLHINATGTRGTTPSPSLLSGAPFL